MLKNRFLSVFFCCFAAGIAAGLFAGIGREAVAFLLVAILVGVSAMVCGLLFCRGKLPRNARLYVCFVLAGLLLGSGWLWVRSLPYARMQRFVGRTDSVVGTVTDSGSSQESAWLDVRVERSKAALPQRTVVRLYASPSSTVRTGDRIEATVSYSRTSTAEERGTSVSLVANGTVTSVRGGSGLLASFRRTVIRACDSLYSRYGVSGTAQALLVRERSALSYGTAALYRNAGLSHLLAISGLHLAVLAMAFRRMLAWLRVRKQVRELLAMLLLVFYCALTGFSVSVVRASVMLAFTLFGEITLHRVDRLTVLFAALMLLLLADPYALITPALQLSFLACLGILFCARFTQDVAFRIAGRRKDVHHRLRKPLGNAVSGLLVSCSASVCTFPVTVLRFGTVAYLAPLLNVFVLPLFEVALTLLMLSVVLYPFCAPVAGWVAILPGRLLQLLEGFLALLQRWSVGSADVDSVWLCVPACLSVSAVVSLLVLPLRHGWRASLLLTGGFAVSLTAVLIFA